MKKLFESYLKEFARDETLAPKEREAMRAYLLEYARMKPVRTAAPAHTVVWYSYFRQPAFAALALVLILGVSSGGIAYAAEGTLPGDLLYPVKVSVVEPLQTAVLTTPRAKAAWQMELAQRRIDEAAALAQQNALTPATETTLAAHFTEHVEKAYALTAQAAATSSVEATISKDTFAARLTTYDAVLAHLESKREATTTGALRASIHAELALLTPEEEPEKAAAPAEDLRPAAAPMRAMTFMAAATSTASSEEAVSAHSDADLSQIDTSAAQAITASANLLSETASSLDASTTEDAQQELARAKALTEEAKHRLEKGDRDGAYQAFRDALTTTAQLEVLTHAAATFKINAFPDRDAGTTTASSTQDENVAPQDGDQNGLNLNILHLRRDRD